MSVSPKIMQLDCEVKCSPPNIVQVDLLSEFNEQSQFKEQVCI